ncbi:MAG TPA: hypothetical protein VFZ98_07250 [Vicinamibacterales bacterium]
MNEPIALSSQRDAVAARRLCDELGFCLHDKDMNIVVAAISGLLTMLPDEAQMHIAMSINARLTASVQLPAATTRQIDSIVKGPDHDQEKQPA